MTYYVIRVSSDQGQTWETFGETLPQMAEAALKAYENACDYHTSQQIVRMDIVDVGDGTAFDVTEFFAERVFDAEQAAQRQADEDARHERQEIANLQGGL